MVTFVHSYNVDNEQCAHETMIGAAEALAAQRFWPSPASNDHLNVLYPVPGPNLVRYYRCCTVQNHRPLNNVQLNLTGAGNLLNSVQNQCFDVIYLFISSTLSLTHFGVYPS